MGTQVRTVCLIGILVLGLAMPVLAQGVGTPPPGPGIGAPSGPGVGAPPGGGGPFFYRRGGFGPGAGYGPRGSGSHRFGSRRFGGGMLVRGVFILLHLLLVVGLLVLIWRLLTARGFWDRLGRRQDPGAEILRERYARGEIDQDEYRKRLAGLG